MKKASVLIFVLLMGFEFNSFSQNEPSCACNPAETVFSLAGKKLLYNELSFYIFYDNSIIIRDQESGKYFKIKSGVQKGPLSEDDPEMASFVNKVVVAADYNTIYSTYREFISKADDKYAVKFKGTPYGSYYDISNFYVTRSGDKFMAMGSVKEPVALKIEKLNQKLINNPTEEQRKQIEAEQVKLMQEELASGEDPINNMKMMTNIAGAKFNPAEGVPFCNTDAKYDDIVRVVYDDNSQATIYSLSGNKLITVKPEHASLGDQIFVNSTNTKYAVYGNGTLTFSDGTAKYDCFNPYLTKTDGKIFLAYLYYSPSKNSVMQCKISF